jgi:hypothetical protein
MYQKRGQGTQGWVPFPCPRRPSVISGKAYLPRDSTKSTSFSIFASETRGEYGGIGAGPQVPLPPFFTLLINIALAPASPLYFLPTSFHAGPTIFFSTLWKAKQPLFFA